MAKLTGSVEKITFQNIETGYTVARLREEGSGKGLVSVVGETLELKPGESVSMEGTWDNHKQYGRQFKFESYQTVQPTSLEGIRRYLGSGLIKGIGPVTAKRIVDHFGEKTLEVIEKAPKRLVEVSGLGNSRVKLIVRAWEDQREIHDVMLFLQSHKVGTGHAVKIWKQYGQDAITLIRENPFRLSKEVWGFGFLTTDQIAQNMGIEKDSDQRLEAGIWYVLDSVGEKNGHVYLPMDALVVACAETLRVSAEQVRPRVDALIHREELIQEEDRVYIPPLYYSEQGVASRCHQLSSIQRIELGNIPEEIAAIERDLEVHFAPRQKTALEKALSHNLLVLTGGPGTGKTTTIKGLIALLEARKKRIALTAPTGRAAKRMSEATGQEAKTIHRLLRFSPRDMAFEKNFKNQLEIDALIVDEVSMVDTVLMNSLLRAVPLSASVVMVGDVDQLPSVGPGNVLRDMIDSGIVEKVELNEIFRQAKTSQIILNAHAINSGDLPDITNDHGSDFFFVEAPEPDQVVETVSGLCKTRLPAKYGLDPIGDIQVLVPMYRGETGAININRVLQDVLNPNGDRLNEYGFRVGDKVMQVRNNYDKDVFNGDVGKISAIQPSAQVVTVLFSERVVDYEFSELDELVLAYAMSVHKSQGAEFRAVVLPLTTQHYMMLQRNLLYTAVTRAKDLVILVGTKKALGIAVRNNQVSERHSSLAERIRTSVSHSVQEALI